MRYEAVLAQTGAFFQRNSALVIPALIVGAFSMAQPPMTLFGSEALEHAKDFFAWALALAGLMWRVWIALVARSPRRVQAERALANLLILSGIIVMHGHHVVMAAGAVLVFFLFESARKVASLRSDAEILTVPAGLRDAGGTASPARIIGWELLTIGLTVGVLWLTDVYEYMPAASAREMRLYLIIASGVLLICILPSYVGDVLSAKSASRGSATDDGPATRGIRVDRRVRSVDVLENWLSLGNLDKVLSVTLEAAALRPGDRLLDVGCGTGRLTVAASEILDGFGSGGDALGIDATPGMIAAARERARGAASGARFQVGVGEALPLPAHAVDAVTSSYFFHHLPADVKRQALREMWRVLAPGGRLVVTDYARPRSLAGWIASFPMRFNFHEHVREQLAGGLQALLEEEALGNVEIVGVFIGYITVFRVRKPPAGEERVRGAASTPARDDARHVGRVHDAERE